MIKEEKPKIEEDQKENSENIENNSKINEQSDNQNQVNQTQGITNQPPTIPLMFPPQSGMLPMNPPQGMPMNYMNQFPYLGYNPMNDQEEDDDPDPILDDDSTDLNIINPFILMEKPALIVKKNLVDKKWFLIRGEKILGNYNSEQLLYFLTSQIQQGNKFENMSINDHTSDLHFKPIVLYDTLRKYVPKLKKRYLKKVMEQNKEMMKKIQQQHQQMIQLNQMKLMQMNNQMKMMQNNNVNNNINNRNNNNHYNTHGYNNNNYNYNNKYNTNNHGYNNNQYYGGNKNINKKPYGRY